MEYVNLLIFCHVSSFFFSPLSLHTEVFKKQCRQLCQTQQQLVQMDEQQLGQVRTS